MKYLGIDYGDSKVGLAIADSEIGLALPYKIINGKDWQELFINLSDIIKADEIGLIVVGIPINTHNKNISTQEHRVRQFIEALREKFIDIDIVSCDERFSTQATQKLGVKNRNDDVAAMLILQNYLDGLN